MARTRKQPKNAPSESGASGVVKQNSKPEKQKQKKTFELPLNPIDPGFYQQNFGKSNAPVRTKKRAAPGTLSTCDHFINNNCLEQEGHT